MTLNKQFNDSKFINPDTINLYARTNEIFLKSEPKGIIMELPGLGGGSCMGGSQDRGDYCNDHAKVLAEKGIILAYMFPGPWSWGNKAAVRMTDAVVAALAEKYKLNDGFPLAVSGGSMGGLGSLMYAAGTRYNLKAVFAACPCTDVPKCFNAHPDFPRTFISAVGGYDMPLEDALKEISPIHKTDDMPNTFYHISCDGADEVFPQEQCDTFVEKLREKGYNVVYRVQPEKLHGEFLPEVWDEIHDLMAKIVTE